MLKKRIITSAWGIPLLVAAVWFEKPLPWFTLLVAFWGLLASLEFYRMVDRAKVPPLTAFGVIWTLLFILRPHFDYDWLTPLLITSLVVFSLSWLLKPPRKEGAFLGWAWTVAGVLYIGWLLSYYVSLRLGYHVDLTPDEGRNWVFFALFTTFGCDTAAFFVGRTWGSHRLAPKISPGKTWEGALAGAGGAIMVSLLFTSPKLFTIPNPVYLQDFSYLQAILLGLVVSIFGQLGDLVESLLKRNMGVKDSGGLLPGHGGVLDRTDSLVFAGVVVYYYLLLMRIG